MMSQTELANLLQPAAGGHDEVIDEVMGQHGEGAFVMLNGELVTVM